MHASLHSYLPIVSYLLSLGADIHTKDKKGHTVLSLATYPSVHSLLQVHYLRCTAGVLAEVVEAVNPCPPPYTWAAPGIPQLILSFMVCEAEQHIALSDVEEAFKRTLSVFSRWRERDTGKRKRKGSEPLSEGVNSCGSAKRQKVGGE